MNGGRRPELELVRGGRPEGRERPARITVASGAGMPPPDALVLEEDTWLILSADMQVTEPAEHPVRLLTRLHDAEPAVPGKVLIRGEDPLTLLAVVHDFDAEPCCRPEWIEVALRRLLDICRERRVATLGVPLFGVAHGRLLPEEVIPLMVRVLLDNEAVIPLSVQLDVPSGLKERVERLISGLSPSSP